MNSGKWWVLFTLFLVRAAMADEKIVQNECADFYPITDLNNLIEQLYHHMDYDCLYKPAESNLFLTGVPVIVWKDGMERADIDHLIRERSQGYDGEFVIVQEDNYSVRANGVIYIKPSQKMIDAEYSIFHNRYFPKNIPRPKIEEYILPFRHLPMDVQKNYKNMRHAKWGDYRMATEVIWEKENSLMTITSTLSPGQEFFAVMKQFSKKKENNYGS